MSTITIIRRYRANGKLHKCIDKLEFSDAQAFHFRLWELLQVDSYRVNDNDSHNVVLTVDNGV